MGRFRPTRLQSSSIVGAWRGKKLYLVLETKGQDSEQNWTKRKFLDEWVRAVNEQGGFGQWSWNVLRDPGDLEDIVAKHGLKAG